GRRRGARGLRARPPRRKDSDRPQGDRARQAARGGGRGSRRRPVHDARRRPLLLASRRRRAHRPAGGGRVEALNVERNLAEIRAEIGDEIEIVAAVKYLAPEDLQALADAGLTTVGENRAQQLEEKAAAYPGVFTWDFIGQLQSRKVKVLAPLVRRIHSLASDSALKELAKLDA